MDLATDDEKLKESEAGFLLAGSISTIEPAFKAVNSGTVCCCMLAAATTQMLPGGNFGAIEAAPHPDPEDMRGWAMGSMIGERIVVT